MCNLFAMIKTNAENSIEMNKYLRVFNNVLPQLQEMIVETQRKQN